MNTMDALNKLAKWRNVLTGWQLGTRAKGDPESDAVRDHREATLLMRVEVTALTALLLKKKIFTEKEWADQLCEEATYYDGLLEDKFPGIKTDLSGVVIDPTVAKETMRGWKP